MTRARELANLGNNTTDLEAINAVYDAGGLTGRNLIINGQMQVAQRSTSAVAASGTYSTVDRFIFSEGTDGAYTSEQSSTAPDGFSNSIKLAVTAADTSLAADQYAFVQYRVEAQDVQQLSYGSNSAKNITLSFWVRSNKTGTYCITIDKNDATRYHFIKEYSIDTADTWEKKIITIQPDSNIKASGGAITDDNGIGLRLYWQLALGSTHTAGTDNAWTSDTNDLGTSNQVNWMDTISNDFYITGVQLEVGETATPFEHRSYGDELAKCQRYLPALNHQGNGMYATGKAFSSTGARIFYQFKVTPRTNPTGISISAAGDFRITNPNDGLNTLTGLTFQTGTNVGCRMSATVSSGLTTGNATELYIQSSDAQILFTGVEL